MDVFDSGSELSDVGSISPPQTPGEALTPQTSPLQNKARRLSPDDGATAITSARRTGRSKGAPPERPGSEVVVTEGKGSGRQSKKDKASRGGASHTDDGASTSKHSVARPAKGGERRKKESKAIPQAAQAEQSPPASVSAPASAAPKKSAWKGYELVPILSSNTEEEDPVIAGKRRRRPTLPYVNKPANLKRKSSSAMREEVPASPLNLRPEHEAEAEAGADRGTPANDKPTKPRRSIKLNLTADKSIVPTDEDPVGGFPDEGEEFKPELNSSPASVAMDEDGDEDEDEAQPSRKRKRAGEVKGRKKALLDEEDNGESEDEGVHTSKSKASKQRNKKKQKEARREKQIRKQETTFDADDGSDDYQGYKSSEDEVMSDDADKEQERKTTMAAKTKTNTTQMPRLKRKSTTFLDGRDKKVEREKVAEVTMRSAAPGITMTPRSTPGPAATALAHSTQAKPAVPPKAVIRKAPSMNLFDNLMGYSGTKSKDSTPNKVSALKGRPSGSGVNTPQGSSPMVRPAGQKKEGDTKVGSPMSSTTSYANNGNGTNRMNSAEVKGVYGQHITADEMKRRKERELVFNSNPKGLFDLLEGAEIMMQFEDETRQLLPNDALLARYKLYRLSRTEGMSKLVDRIKESAHVQKLQRNQSEIAEEGRPT
ncbi:hypothetical protein CBS101457_003968 [Exobasidium rhododendri]|nr:hypothetical protein CBS101457_003968 [Exobasidium rhododendri]